MGSCGKCYFGINVEDGQKVVKDNISLVPKTKNGKKRARKLARQSRVVEEGAVPVDITPLDEALTEVTPVVRHR